MVLGWCRALGRSIILILMRTTMLDRLISEVDGLRDESMRV